MVTKLGAGSDVGNLAIWDAATSSWIVLGVNKTTTKKMLRQYGDNSAVTSTAWAQIINDDVDASAAIAKSKISTSGAWPLADLPSVPQCRAYRTTDQTIGHAGAGTLISFNAELYDTDTMHDLSTNPTRLTATTAGLYAISGNAVFQEHATGDRQLRILANGDVNIAVSDIPVNSASAWAILNIGTQYRLTAGQYVELVVYQASGGDLAIRYVVGYSPHFTMAWLSP